MLINDHDVDILPINGVDHVEFYVGNAKQSAYFYEHAFGFEPIAYAGLETGEKDRCSYVLQKGKIRFVLTSSLQSTSEINLHMAKHGDGIKTVALWVDDAKKAYETTISRGAQSYFSPISESDEHGLVTRAGIHTYGDTVHVFVERNNYQGIFLPRYKKIKARKMRTSKSDHDTGLLYVDHVVGNVETGQMNHWANFYTNVLGFKQLISFDDKDISTEYTALMSKVMCNDNLRIKFPINEPAPGKLVSQIQEFLDFYNGPGVQHLALTTNDIIATVKALKARGVDFLYVPASYYDTVLERCGAIEENLEELKENRILIDRDESGYLLQIFTKPLQERPTLFFEIIQRKGAKSFGKGNFKALFESIEREQKKRGTL